MCGIAGCVGRPSDYVEPALAAMVAAQSHRGPDDQGLAFVRLQHATIGLGHRRLSILDLSPLGHQPMRHPETGDLLVFNGEVYNFRQLRDRLQQRGCVFQSSGDTEVLLHALVEWGDGAVARLQGMYALAYYDARRRRLLLARDPAGIKPLYLYQSSGRLLFASEVRALVASGWVPRDTDAAAVAGYLAYGNVPEPTTIVRNVKMFPAGCLQWIDLGGPAEARVPTTPKRYWDYPSLRPWSEEAVVPVIRQTLIDAVKDHLVSDAPVGVFLSSGLDSTVIAGLAARLHPEIQCFTVELAEDAACNESPLARSTARRFRLPHTVIRVTGESARHDALRWMGALDQPSIDGLNTYLISQAVRQQGVKVALSGLGGDELFCGYSSAGYVPSMLRWRRRLQPLPPLFRRWALTLGSLGRPLVQQAKLRDMASRPCAAATMALLCRRLMSDGQLRALGIEAASLNLTADFLTPEALRFLPLADDDVLRTVSVMESHVYQGNMLLRDSDTNGMAHGLEIRVPFLDHRLLNLVHSIPGHIRRPAGSEPKHLERRAFADELDRDLLRQKKRGFRLPVDYWMKGAFRSLCEDCLQYLKSAGLLNPQAVDRIWGDYVRSSVSWGWSRPWSLVVLGKYLETMTSAVPAARSAGSAAATPAAYPRVAA